MTQQQIDFIAETAKSIEELDRKRLKFVRRLEAQCELCDHKAPTGERLPMIEALPGNFCRICRVLYLHL